MKKTFSSKPHLVTPVMEERITLVAYGEGSFWDRFVVHYNRSRNPKVEALYQAHLETVRQTKQRFSEVVCPDRLEARLLDVCEANSRRFSLLTVMEQFAYTMRATGAIAAVVILGLVLWGNSMNHKQHEIELATLQAKESLALISSIMDGTRKTVHDKVILEQTSLPLRESIYKGTETIKKNL